MITNYNEELVIVWKNEENNLLKSDEKRKRHLVHRRMQVFEQQKTLRKKTQHFLVIVFSLHSVT